MSPPTTRWIFSPHHWYSFDKRISPLHFATTFWRDLGTSRSKSVRHIVSRHISLTWGISSGRALGKLIISPLLFMGRIWGGKAVFEGEGASEGKGRNENSEGGGGVWIQKQPCTQGLRNERIYLPMLTDPVWIYSNSKMWKIQDYLGKNTLLSYSVMGLIHKKEPTTCFIIVSVFHHRILTNKWPSTWTLIFSQFSPSPDLPIVGIFFTIQLSFQYLQLEINSTIFIHWCYLNLRHVKSQRTRQYWESPPTSLLTTV